MYNFILFEQENLIKEANKINTNIVFGLNLQYLRIESNVFITNCL